MKKRNARPLVNLSKLGLTRKDIQTNPNDPPQDIPKVVPKDNQKITNVLGDPKAPGKAIDKRKRRRIRKRPALRPPTLQNDIYLSRKSRSQAVEERVKRLLYPEVEKQGKHKIPLMALMKPDLHALAAPSPQVILHALGALLPRAISLATLICDRSHGDIMVDHVSTTTTQLVDDIVVMTEAEDPQETEIDKMEIVQGDNQSAHENVLVRFNSGIHITLKRRS